MRVLVCGSRKWGDAGAIEREICVFCPDEVIHGACSGADEIAGDVAPRCRAGLKVRAFPANWDAHGKAAGPLRNAEMIATAPDIVLAFSATLEERSGTLDCIRKALAAGIEVRIFPK